jgi:hypothetical protein
MNPSLNLLVLRPSDLNHDGRQAAFADVVHTDFRVPKQVFNEADGVLYIEGTRTKFLKDRYGKSGKYPCPYRPSSFSARTADIRVVGEVLFCTFPADEQLGIEAGMLVCQPWTAEDDDRAHPDDDVQDATVSRQNEAGTWLKFHDIGFFIPDYTTDGL